MAKKLTKAQLAEIERIRSEKARKRNAFLKAYNNYNADIKAYERVYNKDKATYGDKLTVYGYLVDEEKDKIYNSYEELAFIKEAPSAAKAWDVAYMINASSKVEDTYLVIEQTFDHAIRDDDLYIGDIIWTKEEAELIVNKAKEFGYKTIQLFDRSSAALEVTYYLINMGCKLTSTNKIVEFRRYTNEYVDYRFGLVFEVPEDDTNVQ